MFHHYAIIEIKALPSPHVEIDEDKAVEISFSIFADPVIGELAEAIKQRVQSLIPASYEPTVIVQGTAKR